MNNDTPFRPTFEDGVEDARLDRETGAQMYVPVWATQDADLNADYIAGYKSVVAR
jgi:hypothetical protein